MADLDPAAIYEEWRQQALPVYEYLHDVTNFLGHNVVPPPWDELARDKQQWWADMVRRAALEAHAIPRVS